MKAPTLAFAAQLAGLWFLSLPLTGAAQTREARALDGFDAIEVGGGIDLYLRQGSTFAVEVEGSTANIIRRPGRSLEYRSRPSWRWERSRSAP